MSIEPKYIFYLMILSIFVSPSFTPISTIGSEGILRLDQVLLPILLLIIVFTSDVKLNIFVTKLSLIFGLIALLILASLIYGTYILSHNLTVGNTYDVILWGFYFSILLLMATNLSTSDIKKSILFIFIGTLCVSLLGLLQVFNIWESIDVLQSIYGPGKYMRSGRVESISFNPNVYASLLLLPSFILLCELLRNLFLKYKFRSRFNIANPYTITVILILFVAFVNIYFTYSRTAIVGLILGVSIFAFIGIQFSELSLQHSFTLLLSGFIGAFVLLSYLSLPGDLGRYSELINPLNASSIQARIPNWKGTLPVIRESPLIGYGPSSEGYVQAGVSVIDSGLLGWWYHYGLLGVLAFLSLLAVVIQYSTGILIQYDTIRENGLVWSLSMGMVLYSLVVPVMWLINPMPRYRRTFMLYLVCVILIASFIYNKQNEHLRG